MSSKEYHTSPAEGTTQSGLSSRQTVMLSLVIAMGLVLILGFMIVIGTMVYRVSKIESGSVPATTSLTLPEGAKVISVTLDGGVLGVVFDLDGERQILLTDWENGLPLKTIRLLERAAVPPAFPPQER